ncbi:hypothetical protein A8D95_38195 [Burkholderia cenocepacia]|jgi:hypothetical protein|uniref:Uncharacterized protein n=1 Tax=Burkholderia cenocepacia TaxID=95486 RepID=A0A142PMR3_9BURK|nr:hypothetical protein DM42_2748 [Burkholderia cepacia]ALV56185.1 hypothetical protein TQ36_07915 [Burkholderia cenocepacia]PZX03483.1 hypothetical protein DFS13_105285 [Burkholderia sp. 28_3]AMU06329.1 hypothetical protein A2T82_08570 [Burkholderia cenocepacia]AMU17304.1 hypothetical protein A3203_31375 [Burkholderia cenocepacia]
MVYSGGLFGWCGWLFRSGDSCRLIGAICSVQILIQFTMIMVIRVATRLFIGPIRVANFAIETARC